PFGLGLIHNGNIVNHRELAAELKKKNRRNLLTHSDSEVVLNLFAEGLAQTPAGQGKEDLSFGDICKAAQKVFKEASGSYSIVTMIADHGLVAFRDPNGIRPLVWGRRRVNDGSG